MFCHILAPSVPKSLSATPSSADQTIRATWSKGQGVVDKFYLMASGPKGWSVEKEISYQNNIQPSYVLHAPVSGLYYLRLKAQSNNVNSSFTQPNPVQLRKFCALPFRCRND